MNAQPLTAAQLAERLGYSVETIYSYARAGRLPAPIDMSLSARMWRWAPGVVEQYEAGQWTRPTKAQVA